MFPLGPGRYLVANGGGHALVNAHMRTLEPDPRYRAWRGQSYGVDLVQYRPDMPVPTPDPDRARLAGNHVMLECGGIEILLAHLREGSVRVDAGDQVAQGQLLGVVGNSGNSFEPHLHVRAQRRGPNDPLIGGMPVVIRFSGDYLVRNQRVSITSPSTSPGPPPASGSR
jgi:murein DD-endopeptidase MepM/ murein hydrolase activator NlpD